MLQTASPLELLGITDSPQKLKQGSTHCEFQRGLTQVLHTLLAERCQNKFRNCEIYSVPVWSAVIVQVSSGSDLRLDTFWHNSNPRRFFQEGSGRCISYLVLPPHCGRRLVYEFLGALTDFELQCEHVWVGVPSGYVNIAIENDH